MSIYEYNSSTINEYLEDSYGLLFESTSETFDCGKITDNCEENENYFLINYSESLIPFGKIKLSRIIKSNTKKVSSFFIKLEKINKKSINLNGLIFNWIGYGTVFEFDNGLERQLIPDVSGGGGSNS